MQIIGSDPNTNIGWDCVERRKFPLVGRTSFKTITIAVAIAATVCALDLSLPLGVAGGVPYVALVFVGWWFPQRRTIFLLAVVSSVLTVVGYYFSPEGGIPWVVLTNRAYALFAIWGTAITLWAARRSSALVLQSEANLKYATEQLNAVLEADPDVIIVSDQQGRITRANSEIEKLLGYSPDEALGLTIEDLIPSHHQEDHPNSREAFFSGKRRQSMDAGPNITAKRKDGSEVPVDIALGAFKIKGASYAVASIRDMTKQREIEAQLRDAKDRAENFAQAKSKFLANMSHELRTPLNAIIGFSEALLSKTFGPFSNDTHEEYVTHVHNSGGHLLNIINDILDMSKVDAGKMDLHDEEVNLTEMVKTCFEMMETRARDAGVRLTNNVMGQAIILRADGTRMTQILLNLLSNAVKFTDAGGAVSANARILDDGSCALSIIDQGIGMNDKAVQIALEPFGQVDSALNRQLDGTGLGLPLTKALAELHGGALELESEEGKGTSATIYMPAERTLRTCPIN